MNYKTAYFVSYLAAITAAGECCGRTPGRVEFSRVRGVWKVTW